MFDATIPWPCAGVGDSGRRFWCGCFWLLLLGWLFLALTCRLAVYGLCCWRCCFWLSFWGGCCWLTLPVRLFGFSTLVCLLLGRAAGALVPGLRFSHVCFWFVAQACFFLILVAEVLARAARLLGGSVWLSLPLLLFLVPPFLG